MSESKTPRTDDEERSDGGKWNCILLCRQLETENTNLKRQLVEAKAKLDSPRQRTITLCRLEIKRLTKELSKKE